MSHRSSLSRSLSKARSLAHLHAIVVIEELRRCGVDLFCLSPGARAIPLILALDDQPCVATKLFNDERSAAFWAQGAAKGGALPCLICTSGTAAANYLPAVAEAALSGAPMLILTTDRPFELQYAKANQTLPQRDLFAPFAQTIFEIPAPEQQIFLHSLLGDLDQAVFEMRRSARPVHLNMAYRKPFVDESFNQSELAPEDTAILARWGVKDTPYCDYILPQIELAPRDFQRIVERVANASRIVCVAGPLTPTHVNTAIQQLAAHLGAVLLADINSGLRFHAPPRSTLALYNLYLRDTNAQLSPSDLVLYFGDRIISEPLREYLATSQPELILCSSYPLRQDCIENEFIYPTMKVWSDPCAFANALRAALPERPPTDLTSVLQAEESVAVQQMERLPHTRTCERFSEGSIVYNVFRHAHDHTAIYISASLILREAEYFAPCLPQRLSIGANRGATGIDGVLSSGIGFGEALDRPCTILIGDQALLHDLNALALAALARTPIYIIVLNNYSGAIFHFFDLGATGKRLQNPHAWNFRNVAENFHLAYVCPPSLETFISAYEEAQHKQCSTVFELVVDGASSVEQFQAASIRSMAQQL